MKSPRHFFNLLISLVLVLASACSVVEKTTSPTPSLTPPAPSIDADRMYGFLEELTAVQAYSGWRTSATQGEKEAFDYVQLQLGQLANLTSSGLEVTRESFNVFLATEIHKAALQLSSNNGTVDVPVNGLRGSRNDIQSALRLDSDGVLNDTDPNPVTVSGEMAIVRDGVDAMELAIGSMKGKVLFVDYAWIDINLVDESKAMQRTVAAIDAQPEGIVFVTQYSNAPDASHGTYLADLGTTSYIQTKPSIPTIYMRLEDLPGNPSDPWQALGSFGSASLTWDTDVLSPGTSANLITKIPGKNHERGVLLSAHLDSANTPGALDDGAGSAILLEIAATFNQTGYIPEYDLYLVWYGSEELGLLGSANFTASHQEIVDKLIGMVNIDCLSRPVEGAPATLNFAYGSGMQPGDTDDPWITYLSGRAKDQGIDVQQVYMPLASDNSSFAGYNVANFDIVYDSEEMMDEYNGVWFAGHLHDPYDEVTLVREVEPEFLNMAKIALDAATLPAGVPTFRQEPADTKRIVLVASHTEDVLMTPAGMFDLGLAFENAGYDVDVVPFGSELNAADLENAALVIALPAFDLPGSNRTEAAYDVAWTQGEIGVLKSYVDSGGTLLITNAASRLGYYGTQYEANEDWSKMNLLSESFGISYMPPQFEGGFASDIVSDELTDGMMGVLWYYGDGICFTMEHGTALALISGDAVLGKVEQGSGTVIALADIGMLGADQSGLLNPQLVQNLIDYAQK